MADEEQLKDTVDEESNEVDLSKETETDEIEENEIILAGQDEPTGKPEDPTPHILRRVQRREEKTQLENQQLKEQLQQLANQSTQTIKPKPIESNFDSVEEYSAAEAIWYQELVSGTVSKQLNQEQNGHRIAAQEQERNVSYETYAKSAAGLKVSDFNETQDKAFDILGDDFARSIAETIPEEAPKLLYYLGKNPREAERYRDDYKLNPGKTNFLMGKLAGKLTLQPKRTKAADPETKVEGASVGDIGDGDWQTQIDKVRDAADESTISKSINKVREIKKQAKAAGFDVSTLK